MPDNYQVIARRWRPRRFRELVGQEPIVQTLENAIHLNHIAHAFLFIGPRGTGKTSTARLLAMALNAPENPSIDADPDVEPCRSMFEGNCLDVIEIDGASNNSVEQIRDLREACQYTPTTCRFKIYIIDEVHMLSQAAFNALLKTLEEPPEHVKFIFATTEAYKIPQTIISRCQCFEFKPIAEEVIFEKLQQITQQEGIEAEPIALHRIAQIAEGGMRDAQSILEQLTSFGDNHITEKAVTDAYGLASGDQILEIFRCVEEQDYSAVIALSKTLKHCNFYNLLSDLARAIRRRLETLTDTEDIARYLKFLEIVIQAQNNALTVHTPEIFFQLALARAIEAFSLRSIAQIVAELKNSTDTHKPESPQALLSSAPSSCIAMCDASEEKSPQNEPEPLSNPESLSTAFSDPSSTSNASKRISSPKEALPKKENKKSLNIGQLDELPEKTRQQLSELFHIDS